MTLLTIPLHTSHPKKDFSCGKEILDTYLKQQAAQDIKRKLAACFVLIDEEDHHIKGYYTLSNNSIPLDFLPVAFKKQLPKSYRYIPTTLLGRLAVNLNDQGTGLGKILLVDALKRSWAASTSIGSFAVVVDPLDEEAEAFYTKFGFLKLPDSAKMFLAMKTVAQLFQP